MKNIFVIGSDPFHMEMVRKVHNAKNYHFHSLLDYDEVIKLDTYHFDELLAKAERQLREFSDSVDAVIVHWDFPASTLQPILCQRWGLRSATLESVLKCEHKYWARQQQQQAIPEYTPRFAAFDPFDDQALDKLDLDYPIWIKPIKSFASQLGFRINNDEDFQHAIPIIQKNIPRLGDGFNEVMGHAQLPSEIAAIDGYHCIAEEITKGRQCGVEGHVCDGRIAVHGVFDGVKDVRRISFTRWEYPSVWPRSVQECLIEATSRLIAHIGYDNAPFCVEFFWDEESDRLWVLETNTRISQSHSDQCIKVEGVSNHEVAIDIALGRQPDYGHSLGDYVCAAKFLLRKYRDVTVTRVPSATEIAAIEEEFSDSRVIVVVEKGQSLSTLREQDSYSFEIANIFLGAQSQKELLAKYREVAHRLHFEFSDGQPVEEWQFRMIEY